MVQLYLQKSSLIDIHHKCLSNIQNDAKCISYVDYINNSVIFPKFKDSLYCHSKLLFSSTTDKIFCLSL